MTPPAGTLEGETGIQNKHINAASKTISSQASPEATISVLSHLPHPYVIVSLKKKSFKHWQAFKKKKAFSLFHGYTSSVAFPLQCDYL